MYCPSNNAIMGWGVQAESQKKQHLGQQLLCSCRPCPLGYPFPRGLADPHPPCLLEGLGELALLTGSEVGRVWSPLKQYVDLWESAALGYQEFLYSFYFIFLLSGFFGSVLPFCICRPEFLLYYGELYSIAPHLG